MRYSTEYIIDDFNNLSKVENKNKLLLMSFEIPGYDPSSVKLFSKCGRNHASSKKPTISNRTMRKVKLIKAIEIDKTKHTICPFDQTQSRSQRQKKYKPQSTPAVGQYNPRIITKPKLTWDILKTYHTQKKRRIEKQKVTISQQLSHHSEISEQSLENKQTINHKDIDTSPKFKQRKISEQGEKQSVKRYHTVKSQVDMSRMTGRQSKGQLAISTVSINTDFNQSIAAVKVNSSKNYHFDKQISRQRANRAFSKMSSVDYSYDYSIVKPKHNSIVPFDKVPARKWQEKKNNSAVYSYSHYDYNNYVWGGKSSVYPNTKVSVINFQKQRGRYD